TVLVSEWPCRAHDVHGRSPRRPVGLLDAGGRDDAEPCVPERALGQRRRGRIPAGRIARGAGSVALCQPPRLIRAAPSSSSRMTRPSLRPSRPTLSRGGGPAGVRLGAAGESADPWRSPPAALQSV